MLLHVDGPFRNGATSCIRLAGVRSRVVEPPPVGERAFTFGSGATMLGITSEPASPAPPGQPRPAVIVINAGIVHRIGPARNAVDAARRLADEGFLVLRFDLSGLGDSESRRGGTWESNALVDIKQAMDHLEKTRGVRSFVLMGLCSGADHAFTAAVDDPRVVGAVLLDGYGYRTRRFYAHHYGTRALALRSNKGALRRLGLRVAAQLKERAVRSLRREPPKPPGEEEIAGVAPAEGDVMNQWQRPFPPREEFARDVGKLVARDLKLLFVFTGGIEQYYNYPEQLADSLPEVDVRGRIDVEHLPTSDHTITELENKARFLTLLVGWFRRRFPAPRALTSGPGASAGA